MQLIAGSNRGNSKAEAIEIMAEAGIEMAGVVGGSRRLKQLVYSQGQCMIKQTRLPAKISALAVLELMILAAHFLQTQQTLLLATALAVMICINKDRSMYQSSNLTGVHSEAEEEAETSHVAEADLAMTAPADRKPLSQALLQHSDRLNVYTLHCIVSAPTEVVQ